MRKIITFLSLAIFLVSCASPAPEPVPTTTPIPSPTQTATATSTATPVPTSTITATPDPLEGLPEELKEFSRIAGNTIDLTDGIAFDAEGNVHWAKGENGEWINYPGGVMVFPAGDGSGAPDLHVPYLKDFNSMATLFSSDFPWNDMGVTRLDRQKNEDVLEYNRYWKPYQIDNQIPEYESHVVRVHITSDPSQWATIMVDGSQLLGGRVITTILWRSKTTDLMEMVIVDGDPNEIAKQLSDLNTCYGDMGASADAVCQTDIFIPAVNEN